MFTQSYYLQRAAEIDALAAQAPDSALRAGFEKLAQVYRDLANVGGLQLGSDEEAVSLAERIVGKGI